jgi:hypothetical protein
MTSDAITPEPDPRPEPGGITPEPGATNPEPPPAPRFDTEPYRVVNPAPFLGTMVLLFVLPVAGLVIGLVASVIAQWFYLVILFPVGMGVLAGLVGMFLVTVGKARGTFVLLSAAVAVAATTVLGLQFGKFIRFLNVLEEKHPGVRAMALRDPSAFRKFMDFQAEQGVTIGRPGRGDKGMNLGYAGSYIYWLVEAGLVGVMAFTLMRAAASVPLCERCRRWKQERVLGQLPAVPAELVSGPLIDGELLTLLERATESGGEGFVLKVAACPECGPEACADVTLEQQTRNKKGEVATRQIGRVRYPGAVLPLLDARRGQA